MIKHVGKHNQRKVAIVYKTVPNEDHMALVVYTDNLPMMIHDEAMKVLESAVGQDAKELADALFRHTMPDGRNCLETLHRMGHMKKVPTNQVIVTPTAKSTVRLDELNDILAKMEAGGEAAQKLADMDKNRGIRGTQVNEGRELGQPAYDPTRPAVPPIRNTDNSDVLSDIALSEQRLDQAKRMEADAKSLLAEAKRLKAEAESLNPTPAKKAPAKAKTTTPATEKTKNVRKPATKKTAA